MVGHAIVSSHSLLPSRRFVLIGVHYILLQPKRDGLKATIYNPINVGTVVIGTSKISDYHLTVLSKRYLRYTVRCYNPVTVSATLERNTAVARCGHPQFVDAGAHDGARVRGGARP